MADKTFFTKSDLPWTGLVALFIALAVVTNYTLAQPYATFSACGGVIVAFVMILGWIRARTARITYARKVPKLTARKAPKQ